MSVEHHSREGNDVVPVLLFHSFVFEYVVCPVDTNVHMSVKHHSPAEGNDVVPALSFHSFVFCSEYGMYPVDTRSPVPSRWCTACSTHYSSNARGRVWRSSCGAVKPAVDRFLWQKARRQRSRWRSRSQVVYTHSVVSSTPHPSASRLPIPSHDPSIFLLFCICSRNVLMVLFIPYVCVGMFWGGVTFWYETNAGNGREEHQLENQ